MEVKVERSNTADAACGGLEIMEYTDTKGVSASWVHMLFGPRLVCLCEGFPVEEKKTR